MAPAATEPRVVQRRRPDGKYASNIDDHTRVRPSAVKGVSGICRGHSRAEVQMCAQGSVAAAGVDRAMDRLPGSRGMIGDSEMALQDLPSRPSGRQMLGLACTRGWLIISSAPRPSRHPSRRSGMAAPISRAPRFSQDHRMSRRRPARNTSSAAAGSSLLFSQEGQGIA